MALPALPIDSIVATYKSVMAWQHSGTARDIVVFCEPVRTGCPNHVGYDFINKRASTIYNTGNPYSTGSPFVINSSGIQISGILNIPFASGSTCPVCQGVGFILTPASGIVKARIKWKQSENLANLKGENATVFDGDVRIKVLPADSAIMARANQIRVDGKLCKAKGTPDAVGLRDVAAYYYYFDIAL